MDIKNNVCNAVKSPVPGTSLLACFTVYVYILRFPIRIVFIQRVHLDALDQTVLLSVAIPVTVSDANPSVHVLKNSVILSRDAEVYFIFILIKLFLKKEIKCKGY